jgi:transglutaminase-like putative cysteine protease
MTRKARELETLFLTMFAAVPLYLTYAVGKLPVLAFHLAMGAIALRVLAGKSPELIPARVMRWLAIGYMPFYFIDWRLLGGSAIAASTHLVLFIAVYQPIESVQRNNQAQRMLTTTLIFVASLATSTHVTALLFVIAFGFLMLRQLMYVSHLESVRSIAQPYNEPPSFRAAGFYLAGAVVIGALLFPVLPRVRNPFVHGIAGSLPGGATSLTESIDFSAPRIGTTGDETMVARVWMDQNARSLFLPIRLRGMVYDRYAQGEWKQTLRGLRELPPANGQYTLSRAGGAEGTAIVQQRPQRGKLFLPTGTVTISNLPSRLYEGPARETYLTYYDGPLNMTVRMAYQAEPLSLTRIATLDYPVTPEVAALARSIVGTEQDVRRQASRIEQYMIRNFRYVPNPANLRERSMSVEEFLLRERTGHCEYFAAGMAVLMTALDIPARIVGGFHGGRLNPLTGYHVIRRGDAHAWTEVWDGQRWLTFDSTPPSLRPGNLNRNLAREYLAALSDSMTFVWDRYVLTFSIADQLSLLEDAIAWAREKAAAMRQPQRGIGNVFTPAFFTILGALIALGLVALMIARRRRPLFDALAAHLAARGIEVGPAMTIEDALRQLRNEQPEAARALEPLIALYEEERFSPHADAKRAASIRRRLAELRV